MKLYQKSNWVYFENGDQKVWVAPSEIDFKDMGSGNILISARPTWALQGKYEYSGPASGVTNANGTAYGSTLIDVVNGFRSPIDISWSDQTTPAIIAPFTLISNSTTLTAQPSIGDYTITVNSATGFSAGKVMIVHDAGAVRYSFFKVLSVAGSVITLDTPIDFAYPIGSHVDVGSDDMNVNGSVTPVIFGIRGSEGSPGVDVDIDITRIIFHIECASAVDLAKFGNLTALTRGVVLRTRNSFYSNIFNIKSNGELAGICYDIEFYEKINPAQGQDGVHARLTFAGPDKIGVAIRIRKGTDLECIIQDDLTGLTHFNIKVEGHVVEI